MENRKASGKKPAKRKAGKRTKTARSSLGADVELVYTGLRSLHARLNDIELSIRQLHGASLAESAFKPTSLGVADTDDTVSIGFKKTEGPDGVTVTLTDTGEDVLRPFQQEGKSRPRKRGETINAKVVVNGGAALNIEVKNASPSALTARGLRLLTVG